MITKKSDITTIVELYFDRMYNYSQIIAHFKNKYSYAEIKQIILNHLKDEKDD